MTFDYRAGHQRAPRARPKLAALGSTLGTLKPALGYAPGDDKARDRYRAQTQPWRAWYKLARWKQLRWSVLVRDLFACQMCKRVVGNTSQLVADHKKPHRGSATLFWDESNVQTLCKPCHDGAKQRLEQADL